MKPTEAAAYGWLVDHCGYVEKNIRFQPTRNPDFVTADSKGWEVKRLIGRVASDSEASDGDCRLVPARPRRGDLDRCADCRASLPLRGRLK